jgi:hypothetical protein
MDGPSLLIILRFQGAFEGRVARIVNTRRKDQSNLVFLKQKKTETRNKSCLRLFSHLLKSISRHYVCVDESQAQA